MIGRWQRMGRVTHAERRPKTVAVTPLSAPVMAKTRLAEALTPFDRQALARWMAERVIRALQASGVIAEVAVVSPSRATLAWASGLGATSILQAASAPDASADQRLNDGLALGRAWAQAQDADALLITLGDLPMLTPAEIAQFVGLARRDERHQRHGDTLHSDGRQGALHAPHAYADGRVARHATPIIALAPDRAGVGTNALLAAPPAATPLAFGGGSFARHQALARRAGVEPLIFHAPGLAFDVDTAPDLAELQAMGLWAPDEPVAGIEPPTEAPASAPERR